MALEPQQISLTCVGWGMKTPISKQLLLPSVYAVHTFSSYRQTNPVPCPNLFNTGALAWPEVPTKTGN